MMLFGPCLRRVPKLFLIGAAFASAWGAAWAQQLGCGNLIPSGAQIVRELRLEAEGQDPVPLLAGVQADRIFHAARFSAVPTTLLNHVCVAARHTADFSETSRMDVTVYLGDQVVNGMLRPGAMVSREQGVPIRARRGASQARYQLVAIPPATVQGTVWIEVAFDDPRQAVIGVSPQPDPSDADPGSAHVGVRRGDSESWTTYFNANYGPEANFRGNRPVIRGLQLQLSPCGPAAVRTGRFSGIFTSELGDTVSFAVVLNTQPAFEVRVKAASSDSSEAAILPEELIFTRRNWNQPQQILVQGVDDLNPDGRQAFQIVFEAQSADACYNGISILPADLTNLDDESASPLTFPHLFAGEVPDDMEYRSTLRLSHLEGGVDKLQLWEGRLQLRELNDVPLEFDLSDGNGMSEHLSDEELLVDPGMQSPLKILIRSSDQFQNGYLELFGLNGSIVGRPIQGGTLAPPNVNVSLHYELFDKGDGGIIDSVAAPRGVLGRRFIFPVEVGSQVDYSLALVPYVAVGDFEAELRLRAADGTLKEEAPNQILTGHRLITVSEQFPTTFSGPLPDPPFLGSVEVVSEQAVYLIAIRSGSGLQFAAAPVVAGGTFVDLMVPPR